MAKELLLRYGMNPHQKFARAFVTEGELPFAVLNGAPGFINLLDALNSWQLVRELRQALRLPAAASFKHVSPAGAAVAVPLNEQLKRAYFIEDMALSPLAVAYARARYADAMSSYGDFAALSDVVDVPTAEVLRREVSDGVIAPGYEPPALEILKRKKQGKYLILEMNPNYEPPKRESRQVFGVTLEQDRDDAVIGPHLLQNIVTRNRDLPPEAQRDLLVATIALKYTQSNSVCFALDGQVIGMGAGQQSRVHCTRLAGGKTDLWWLRQHPDVLALRFKPGVSRAERNNAIDKYLGEGLGPAERRAGEAACAEPPPPFAPEKKRAWLDQLRGVALSSDAYFPFRDSLDRASQSGVQYVLQAGTSLRDAEVIQAADEHGMVMAFSNLRLFHH